MNVVEVSFWAAFVLDLAIGGFAYFYVLKRMGGQGMLYGTTLLVSLSALVFGIHHLLELFLEDVPNGGAIAESVEGVAAILLGLAVYRLYALSKE
ncbi:MAG: hypothetical protein HY681_09755 [Chloroflexi bacterium]|nr:hypothetical protein [Chloroflexota bacterium]